MPFHVRPDLLQNLLSKPLSLPKSMPETKAYRNRRGPARDGVRRKGLRAWFSACPFFRKCSEQFVDRLVDICEQKVFQPEEGVVFEEGEIGETMYIISNGIVEISFGGQPATRLEAGDFFGEINLLGITTKRTSTARPLTVLDLSVMKRAPFVALLRDFPEEAVKIKKHAESIFFNTKAVKVLRQRGGLEIDEQWDIFSQKPIGADDEGRMSEERADQLKELISVVLTSGPATPDIKYVHQQMGIPMTPVRTPRANSSRAFSRPGTSSMSKSLQTSPSEQESWTPRVHSAPSSQLKNLGVAKSPFGPSSPRAQSAPSSQQQNLEPLPQIAKQTDQRLSSTKYATTSFERAMMRDLGGRPNFPTADFLRPQGKGVRGQNLISLYQHQVKPNGSVISGGMYGQSSEL